MVEECLPRELRRLILPTYGDVRERVLSLYSEPVPLPKSVKKRGMVKQLIKLERIIEYFKTALLSKVNSFPPEDEIPSFYLEVMKLGGLRDYGEVTRRIRGKLRYVIKLYRDYKLRIKMTLDAPEARKLAREFIGRALSIYRRLDKEVTLINNAFREISKLPCVDFREPRIVVAGMPQVGKSTFVHRVSTAKPEISPFPFTTKSIILGHFNYGYLRVQVIDTPGILDRLPSEMNKAERLALTSIKHLASAIIFLIDPTPGFYYGFSRQLDLLRMLAEEFKGRLAVVAVNKIDLIDRRRLEEVRKAIKEVFEGPIFAISALKGTGVKELLDYVILKVLNYKLAES